MITQFAKFFSVKNNKKKGLTEDQQPQLAWGIDFKASTPKIFC